MILQNAARSLYHVQCAMRSFYDPDVGDRGLRRMQRKARPTFEFVKQGAFQRQAEKQRLTVSPHPPTINDSSA